MLFAGAGITFFVFFDELRHFVFFSGFFKVHVDLSLFAPLLFLPIAD
jgi:hypothetical protein